MQRRVEKRVPVGLLTYENDTPVAWCSVAPRDTHRPLGGDETRSDVWSLACFFIKREFRHTGLMEGLPQAAIRYAGENGAAYVEAYPVDPDSPSYRFMGFKSAFEKAGFKFVKMAGKRRHVMLLDLARILSRSMSGLDKSD